ncbi:MAG: tRNA (N(6)-L-threonylcarbamoyladenosine(37)-C(2))-methylthiotransferase MtaB, partial [Clostridia bacterium]|nr:tRNA (N(6)-L-threonylcarbamoyladenosine(37)-C(2))-methylthiotransferase MtaB [Clostridia bacterium]
KEARLARLHVFPYSRRSGTVADRLPGQVSEQLKKQRAERLIALGEELEAAFCRESVGQIRPVLFETQSEDGLAEGYTDTYVRVRARAEAGSVQSVCIARAEGSLCFGEIVNWA